MEVVNTGETPTFVASQMNHYSLDLVATRMKERYRNTEIHCPESVQKVRTQMNQCNQMFIL